MQLEEPAVDSRATCADENDPSDALRMGGRDMTGKERRVSHRADRRRPDLEMVHQGDDVRAEPFDRDILHVPVGKPRSTKIEG